MRHVMLQIIFAVSVLLAGIHAPVIAHDGDEAAIGHHHGGHDTVSQARDDTHSSPVGSAVDIGHHHHCPVGLASGNNVALSTQLLDRTVPIPGLTTALTSRATAPPFEPPVT